MIKKGDLTVIDRITYSVIRIEEGTAHLKDVVNPQGRPRKMKVELVPYFNEEGEFIIPEKHLYRSLIVVEKFHYGLWLKNILICLFQEILLLFLNCGWKGRLKI